METEPMFRCKKWRQLGMALLAGVMAVVLVACGEPTKENACDFVLRLTVALYAGDIEPMLESVDFSAHKDAQSLARARQVEEGKLKNLLVQSQRKIEHHGRVDRLEVAEVKRINNTYDIKVLVTYDDGFQEFEKSKLCWSEEQEQFVLVM